MQSEVPISKRHWSQVPAQSVSPTVPLAADGVPEASAMKTIADGVADAHQETPDSSQHTSIRAGSDETDRLPTPSPDVDISLRGASPEEEDAGGENRGTSKQMTAPPSPFANGETPGIHREMNSQLSRESGVPRDQGNLPVGYELPEPVLEPTSEHVEVTPEVGTLSVDDIPPPVIPTDVSGYDNTTHINDLQESRSSPEFGANQRPPSATIYSPDQSTPPVNSHSPDQQAIPATQQNEHQIISTPDFNTEEVLPSPVHSMQQNLGSPNEISTNYKELQRTAEVLDTALPEGKVKEDVPNGVAKVDSIQQQSGYDNAAFTNDETIKDIVKQTGDSSHSSIQDPRIDTIPRDEKDPEVYSEGSPVPPRVPRRVSFSERPPQRAVYDTAQLPGAPLDPAAAAVKEQGLGPAEKWRVLRNVTIISAAFMVLFTAFFGAANLQSSVNPSGGLGTVSLTAVYAALIVSNLFLPSVVIRRLGCKWTVALGMVLFAPYAAAQLAASWASLVPTALLAGAAGAPMWCAKCSYLNAAAGAYAAVTDSPRDLVMVRFFGLFYVLFPLGHVWGNLITSEVLSTGVEVPASNATAAAAAAVIDVAAVCGANFCPAARSPDENPNLARPPDHLITTIAALFIALSLLAALMVAVGVDNLRRYGERLGEGSGGDGHGGGDGGGGAALLVATLRLLGDRNQLFLVPITAFIGISQAFLGADFTESYIACAWGIAYIGYVLMGYGLASSLASVVVSWAVKRAGRLPVVAASIALFLVLVGVLRWWTPHPQQGAAFVLLAAAWGFADSTALVINAMYGLLFRGREAAAYSNFSLWGSAGFIITYSYSPYLCAVTKLAILAVVLILSLAGFIMAERALRKILVAEEEAKKQEENLTGTGISVISDKAHAA